MKLSYKILNNIFGWGIFCIAAIVYLLTIESSASFWDCPEFISTSYKLEVGHPPGAPIFMLLANFFSLFASSTAQVSVMVNSMTAILSALTILFLFWTITHLTRKLIMLGNDNNKELSKGQLITIFASGIVGALAYTFSDTFWFSAVEAEVYGFSSMLTALVIWLILKWENDFENPNSSKWIILISYLIGLSIGVHLLNLLCIPAIVLIYYFKIKDKPTIKGSLGSLILSFIIIASVLFGVVSEIPSIGGKFEVFFVNQLGFSYNVGTFVYIFFLLATVLWCIFESYSDKGNEFRAKVSFLFSLIISGAIFITSNIFILIILFSAIIYFLFIKNKISKKIINLSAICLFVLIIGFSAYAIIPIRSSSNPPLDLNTPEDIISLGGYLNRDQYGETPLLYGPTYASTVKLDKDNNPLLTEGKTSYSRIIKKSPEEKDRYESLKSYSYDYTNQSLFTRMYSNKYNPNFSNHMQGYKLWGGVTDQNKPPSIINNIKYFFNYQVNFMYWRYFMWNFSGRQNDEQGDGGITSGNCITGIPFIDQYVLGLGPQDNVAPDIVDNKGHNKYYMLPLILGILGIIFQLRRGEKGKQSFAVVFMVFFMTGLAIIIYLNQTPFEPRERDYAYAGSFYAFCIWIGMGVAAISSFINRYLKNKTVSSTIALLACICIPIQMASQNWDDHDRSGKTLARDTAINYLSSVGPNGILFTYGDNDTYPLWYLQEVEGYRTDVRVVNLSFLQVGWYIDQMVRQAYKSPPLPITWDRFLYYNSNSFYKISKDQIEKALATNNIPYYSYGNYYDVNEYKNEISLDYLMKNLKTGKYIPNNPFQKDNNQIIPSNILSLNVDSSKVDWKSINAIPTSNFKINISDKKRLGLNEIIILEMINNINNDNWKRPIHFAVTVSRDLYLGLTQPNNLSLNGLSFQVIPGKSLSSGVNIDTCYDNFMNKFKWGGIDKNPNIYLDKTNRQMIYTLRMYFIELISALIKEGQNDKALKALDKCVACMPEQTVKYQKEGVELSKNYYLINQKEKGNNIMTKTTSRMINNMDWFVRLNTSDMVGCVSEIYSNISSLIYASFVCQNYNKEIYQKISNKLLDYAVDLYSIGIKDLGDNILKNIVQISGSKSEGDSSNSKIEESILNRSNDIIKKYSPQLFK